MTDLRGDDRSVSETRPGDRAEGSTSLPSYTLHVDGEQYEIEGGWLAENLLFVLRERIGLRATKIGCERGECGACTVLVDERPRYACLTLAAGAAGATIVTVAGLGAAAAGVRRALVEYGGVRCGVCTPGTVIAIHDMLGRRTYPEEQDIIGALAGISCSCGARRRMYRAVQALVSDQ